MKKWAVFSKATVKVPFFIDKKIGHVQILLFDDYQYSMLNPSWSCFDYYITESLKGDKLEHEIAKDKDIVVLNCTNLKTEYVFSYRLTVLTCVEFAKYVLSIRNFFIFTPKQLYKKLIKLGCERV